jgi:hypothetical protein
VEGRTNSAPNLPVRFALVSNNAVTRVLLVLAWVGISYYVTCQPAQAAPRDTPIPVYSLDAVMFVREGYVAEAAWLDPNQYIYLAVAPEGAAVWRYDYANSVKERFISANFIEEYICPAQYTPRLTWVLSPGKRMLFTHYFDDAGQHFWNLLDISGAPDFRLKNFTPPAGMQINRALFSPDDRFGVFFHDAFREGSDTSVLVLDFSTGAEHWRINTHELSFISQAWWGAAIYDKPRCNAVAQLYQGEFLEQEGLAKLDLAAKSFTYTPAADGVVLGAEALWGDVSCLATGESSRPYELVGRIPGQPEVRVPLTARPVKLDTLPQAGLVLIANTEDQVTTDLWLVDVVQNDKWLVDRDCAGFSLASDGKLLVRGEKNNALRVYLLTAGAPEPDEF